MLGILYLLLAVGAGRIITELFYVKGFEDCSENRIWIDLPVWFGTGILVMTWLCYMISWFFSVYLKIKEPLYYGNLFVFLFFGILFLVTYLSRGFRKVNWIQDRKLFRKELVLFGVILLFVTWTMYYVFHARNGVIYAGWTVHGDYSPHTAMMRSFSRGNNFPTQYPHFGGEDVKYHFMFQFLAGNMEYLGLRLDHAFNIVSILSLEAFLMLFYTFVKRIFRSYMAGCLSVLFFFFRSGTAIFRFLYEHFKAGDLLLTLVSNREFIGYTTNENWGLWCYNVYLNQRHLAFGLLIVMIAILLFWNHFELGDSQEKKGISWLVSLWTGKRSWLSYDFSTALFAGFLLGLSAFWNGAAEISGLLILCGMAIFSVGKLDYLVTAVISVIFSFLQTKIFMWKGSSIGMKFQWGFLAENKSIAGVIWFLFLMSFFTILGMLIGIWFLKRKERSLLLAFLLPLFFGFTISLTPDIAVNHKYILISMHFVSILWAGLVAKLWNYEKSELSKAAGLVRKLIAAVLIILMTANGIYDFVVILMDNDVNHRIGVKLDSALTDWISDNLEHGDLILTPEYSINEVTLAGEMLYMGWPYYGWSAGYDTYTRRDIAVEIYTTDSEEALREAVAYAGVSYILYEEGSEYEGSVCQEYTIKAVYDLVYTSESGSIRIYKVK